MICTPPSLQGDLIIKSFYIVFLLTYLFINY